MSDIALDDLIAKWLEARLDESESERLQNHLRESATARHRFHELVKLDSTIREIAEAGLSRDASGPTSKSVPTSRTTTIVANWFRYALAVTLLLSCGLVSYRIGINQSSVADNESADNDAADVSVDGGPTNSVEEEAELAGYATLRRAVGVQWGDPGLRGNPGSNFREGDLLPMGMLEFATGVIEVDFFCGASVVIEGPASIELESDWSVRLLAGRLRANVPPAARGFIVKAADSEIIDLGTEFALEVGPESARVEVIDGEIELRGGKYNGQRLLTGDRQSILGQPNDTESLSEVSTVEDVQRRNEAQQQQRLERWNRTSQRLRQDDRMVAYYPIVEMKPGRQVINEAATGDERDGVLVGLVGRSTGRFGTRSSGLQFHRPGSRVRVRIDEPFSAFTMACWVKIDTLAHRYNALFMADGYENGEPHWQIRDDGKMMFSVMVDDTIDVRVRSIYDDKIVKDAGKHRVYITETIWEPTQASQWLFLAAVYDPANRIVRQYANDRMVGSEAIEDEFFVEKLRIGPSEIGNWGQPFRPTPWFAVRNLNGVIDELAIFDAALDSNELQTIYEAGKPDGD